MKIKRIGSILLILAMIIVLVPNDNVFAAVGPFEDYLTAYIWSRDFSQVEARYIKSWGNHGENLYQSIESRETVNTVSSTDKNGNIVCTASFTNPNFVTQSRTICNPENVLIRWDFETDPAENGWILDNIRYYFDDYDHDVGRNEDIIGRSGKGYLFAGGSRFNDISNNKKKTFSAVSPAITLPKNPILSFWTGGGRAFNKGITFEVLVSENREDWNKLSNNLLQYSIDGVHVVNGGAYVTGIAQKQCIVDLSAYSEKTIYIKIYSEVYTDVYSSPFVVSGLSGYCYPEFEAYFDEFEIHGTPISISGASVTISDQTYTGKALTPDLTVTLSGKTLEKGKDYTVAYSNNINIGTATATITGCGAYTGTIKKTFKILSATQPATTGSPYNAGDITPEKPVSLKDVENVIIATKNEKDQKGSTFSLLQAKGVPKSKSSIKLSWKYVKGATKYVIYGNKCGKSNNYNKIEEVTGISFTQKKLKKGTYYKYLVAAVSGDQVLAVSKTIHVATKGGKVGNNTRVKLSKKKISLKAGKSKTIKATLKAGSLKVKSHRKVAWESGNVTIAKVNKKGKITGVKKGTCYVYAYAQNGICAKVKVTIK